MKNLRHIFLVDDDLFSINVYRQVLENLGYSQISTFQNASIALYNLEKQPSVIFLDHHMNDISGVEVLKKIKKFNPSIYVVMISGQEKIQVAFDALKHGAYDYIVKGESAEAKMKEVLARIEQSVDENTSAHPKFIDKLKGFFGNKS
jgi:DNA-binding NtrC family response regulator